MHRKTIISAILVILVLLMFTGCVPGDGRATETDPAGFFMGIWHGWIAPISLIASIFRSDLSIFEVNNTGFWYEFGYYMAVVSGFGGLGLARKSKRRREEKYYKD